jgi:DNA-binding transcriptional regulator GbsR (MarR family)
VLRKHIGSNVICDIIEVKKQVVMEHVKNCMEAWGIEA